MIVGEQDPKEGEEEKEEKEEEEEEEKEEKVVMVTVVEEEEKKDVQGENTEEHGDAGRPLISIEYEEREGEALFTAEPATAAATVAALATALDTHPDMVSDHFTEDISIGCELRERSGTADVMTGGTPSSAKKRLMFGGNAGQDAGLLVSNASLPLDICPEVLTDAGSDISASVSSSDLAVMVANTADAASEMTESRSSLGGTERYGAEVVHMPVQFELGSPPDSPEAIEMGVVDVPILEVSLAPSQLVPEEDRPLASSSFNSTAIAAYSEQKDGLLAKPPPSLDDSGHIGRRASGHLSSSLPAGGTFSQLRREVKALPKHTVTIPLFDVVSAAPEHVLDNGKPIGFPHRLDVGSAQDSPRGVSRVPSLQWSDLQPDYDCTTSAELQRE